MRYIKEFYEVDLENDITLSKVKTAIIEDLKKYEYGEDLTSVDKDIDELAKTIFLRFKDIIANIGDEYENDIEKIALKLGE